MTRVLMTTDTVGGVWTYALELADALAPRGVEVVLATMGELMTSDQRQQVERSAVAEVREGRFALEWTDDPWADVDEAGAWLLGLADEVRPDLVHLNGYAHAALPWTVPTVVAVHSCVVTWWQAVHGTAPPPARDEYRRRVGAGLHAATEVVAPTAAMLRASQDAYAYERGAVVPNCRRAGPTVADLDRERLVLAAGRLWDEAKNVVALDRVAPDLAGRVVIVGDATHPDGSSTAFAGARHLDPMPPEQLAGWMARAAIYALPARYEPFGLSCLEAALAGCALVVGDIPSLREVWGDDAVFVDPDDDDALRHAVQALLDDDDRRRDLGARARRRAVGYHPERTAAGYLDVYEQARGRVAVGGLQ